MVQGRLPGGTSEREQVCTQTVVFLLSSPVPISALIVADRDFDFDAYQTRYVALQFFYIGGNYHGFAAQCGTEATIEVSMVLRHAHLPGASTVSQAAGS